MSKIVWTILGSIVVVGGIVSAAVIQDNEFDGALTWGFETQITQYAEQDAFRPFDTLTREQGAKMFSVFAMKNLCLSPDTSLVCNFSDLEEADPTLQQFLTTSCQLGLFQGYDGKFSPHEPLTKAQALTVLIRAIDGKQDETRNPWWSIYFEKARQRGLTKESNARSLDNQLSRYEALLIQYRARAEGCEENGDYPDELVQILSELFGEEDEVIIDDTNNETTTGDSDEINNETDIMTGESISGDTL